MVLSNTEVFPNTFIICGRLNLENCIFFISLCLCMRRQHNMVLFLHSTSSSHSCTFASSRACNHVKTREINIKWCRPISVACALPQISSTALVVHSVGFRNPDGSWPKVTGRKKCESSKHRNALLLSGKGEMCMSGLCMHAQICACDMHISILPY